MIHYFTTYAQTQHTKFFEEDLAIPIGDASLSELGKEQARLLGEHLRGLDFHGKIICSPHQHTLESAQIIADITNSEIIPYAPLHEAFPDEMSVLTYNGMSAEQIRGKFGHISSEPTLPYPWWPAKAESRADIKKRVSRGYQAIFAVYPDEDMLFMCHNTVCDILLELFELEKKLNSRQYNCALTTTRPLEWRFVPTVYDTLFIPYEITTLNAKRREDFDSEYFATPYEKQIDLPDLAELKGERILHIGDTCSEAYPYYRSLIELVKPDVIIHTGDMSDEVKIGRHPEYRYEYSKKISVLLDILRSSGARVIIVKGNHDIVEQISKLAPDAEVYTTETVITLSGIPCRIGHRPEDMTFDTKYSFYGHSKGNDNWRYGFNIPGESCRFNVCYGPYVCDLENDRFARIPSPSLIQQ